MEEEPEYTKILAKGSKEADLSPEERGPRQLPPETPDTTGIRL